MRSLYALIFVFWTCSGVEGSRTQPKCVDKLDNCATLASQGFCNLKEHVVETIKCAQTCGICKSVKSASHVQAKPSMQFNLQQPRKAAPRPPVKVRRPPTKSKANQRRAPQKNTKARSPPKQNPKIDFKPIGPNIIRVDDDVMLAAQMYYTKKKAEGVGKKLDQIGSNVNQIMKGIYETLKAIDESAATHVSHIQMSVVSVLQPRMRSLFGRIGRWKESASDVEAKMDTLSGDMDGVSKEVDDILDSLKSQQSTAGGSQATSKFVAYDMVNREEKSKSRPHLAKSLESFSVDFTYSLKSFKQIRRDMEPYLAIIRNVVKLKDNETKKAKEEVKKVERGCNKIKDNMEAKAKTYKKISADYGTMADEFVSTQKDTQVARSPHTSGDPEKPESKAPEPMQNNQEITIKCANSKLAVYKSDIGLSCNLDDTNPVLPEGRFRITTITGDKISLQESNGKFCTANNEQVMMVVCDKLSSNGGEQFMKVDNGDGSVSLQCHNEKYLTMDTMDFSLKCVNTQNGDQEKLLFTEL